MKPKTLFKTAVLNDASDYSSFPSALGRVERDAEYLGCMANDSVCRNSGGRKGVEGAEEKKTRVNGPWPPPCV